MQLAVISDLHLTVRDGLDEFGHDDHGFLKFLDFLESNFERIVLLGDIWETLNPRVPGRFLQQLGEAQRAHPEIARRFQRHAYHYVHGNHDLVARQTGVPDQYRLALDGKRFVFTHGHQYDALIRRARWLSELGVFVGGWLCRLGLYPLYRLFNQIEGWFAGHSTRPELGPFQRWALTYAEEQQADLIVTGHTHVAQRTESNGRLFLNSGSCTGGRYSFLALDTQRDDYRIATAW